jgi:hypothetical protein
MPNARIARAAAITLAIVALAAGCSSSRSGASPSTAGLGGGLNLTPPSVRLFQAACSGSLEITNAGTVTDPAIDEASGIAASRANPGQWWVHNDSGDSARFFLIDGTAKVTATVDVDGATAHDWEDIAVGPPPTGSGASSVYLADIGDNGAMKPNGDTRPDIQVYRAAEPVVPKGTAPTTLHVTADKLTFTYPDGGHDAETFMVDPVSGDLFIVTKNWSLLGRSSIYRAPAGLKAGSTTVLQKLGDVKLPRATLVTGGDVSSDGSVVALRSYTAVRLYQRTSGQSVAAALQSKPCTGPRPREKQGEAIGFALGGGSYATISEGTDPVLHLTGR